MAGDPIAANAGKIVRVVVEGLHKLLSPPKTRPLALLPTDVLSAEDWDLWRRSELAGLVPKAANLSPEDLAHMASLCDDVAGALIEALHAGNVTLYGVPAGGLERVEILPSALYELTGYRPRFNWPLNNILDHRGGLALHGVVAAGKLPRVEPLRSKIGLNTGGRPPSDTTAAAREARRRWENGAHGGEAVRGALRRCCEDVAAERGLDVEAVNKAARR